MKKIIAIMALAAFACAATAGSDCCPSKNKDKGKESCPAQKGEKGSCPAGGDKKDA
jgi:hypothetical protein